MEKIYRIIDANINRASEGVRVVEDIARFYYNDEDICSDMKNLRHNMRKKFKEFDLKFLAYRDSSSDKGLIVSKKLDIDKKSDLKQLLYSNFKRIQESLRTIEENFKICSNYNLGKEAEILRFESYTIEKKVLKYFLKTLPEGIYGITAEKYSKGRKNVDVVKAMIKGGIKIIQYREKHHEKSLKEMYNECLEIRKITRDNGVLFIVNDYADIAVMTDADGIHIGQDDFPIQKLREIAKDKIIGLSTHSENDATNAILANADYVGVGPIFKTSTKENVCAPVGLEYLRYAVKNIKIPFVAIGGIKEDNIDLILKEGAKTICLVTDIVEADDIEKKVKSLYEKIKRYEG